jgi:hypothetical protein
VKKVIKNFWPAANRNSAQNAAIADEGFPFFLMKKYTYLMIKIIS